MQKEILSIVLIVIAIAFAFAMVGCSYKALLGKIPDVEFDEFTYHRAGNFTSADITAKGCRYDGDKDSLIVDDVSVKADYGPFLNFNIGLKGYKRSYDPETGQETTRLILKKTQKKGLEK